MREPREAGDDSVSGVAVRPVSLEADLGSISRVFELMDLAELGEVITTADEVRAVLAKQDAGAFVARVASEVAAFGSLCRLRRADELQAQFVCLPRARQPSAAILDRLSGQAVAVGARELILWQIADGIASEYLFERRWRPVRVYVRMQLELGAQPQLPRSSEVNVRAAGDQAERRLVHDLIEEALADHWRHHRRSFEDFYSGQDAAEGYDPALSCLAFVGGDPAGALIARIRCGRGVIAWLGTREQFRQRGVASALLLTAFDELEARNLSRVDVDVDTANRSASRVYDRVGMRVQFYSTQWRLTLRA